MKISELLKSLNHGERIILTSALIALTSALLPWRVLDLGFHSHGFPIDMASLFLFIMVWTFSIYSVSVKQLKRHRFLGVLFAAPLLWVLYSFYEFDRKQSFLAMNPEFGLNGAAFATGTGMWLAALAAIILIIGTAVACKSYEYEDSLGNQDRLKQ